MRQYGRRGEKQVKGSPCWGPGFGKKSLRSPHVPGQAPLSPPRQPALLSDRADGRAVTSYPVKGGLCQTLLLPLLL